MRILSSLQTEIHQRLKFNRRGLVGMANGGANNNTSQFFITLDKTEELNKTNTLFGKITGNTLFNILPLADVRRASWLLSLSLTW